MMASLQQASSGRARGGSKKNERRPDAISDQRGLFLWQMLAWGFEGNDWL